MSRVRWWDSDDADSSAEFSGDMASFDSGSKEEPDENVGTDVDGTIDNATELRMDNSSEFRMDNSTELRMESESPSSELEKLQSGNTSDNESMESGKNGSYDVNPEVNADNIRIDVTNGNENGDIDISGNVSSDGKSQAMFIDLQEPITKKLKSDRRLTDSVLLEKHSSDGSSRLNESLGSRPSSAASSGKSGTPGKEKDPIKREKEREREERIKHAQLKLNEERQRKIEEMREQQRLAQENREKQLEARRRKIEDLKKREEERRKQVEERRRLQEETDRAKKEAILSKAKERLTRYEQWKAHGRKGGRRHVLGFGSRTPREVCFTLDARRSSSQSTLRRSPNSSDYDSYFNRRAVSASSVVRRHCCIDINKLTQGTARQDPYGGTLYRYFSTYFISMKSSSQLNGFKARICRRYPGESPPSKKLSVSMSALYHKRSPDFSSTGALHTKGSSNLKKDGAESMMALHSIPENRLGRSIVASAPPTKHKSAVNLAGVKMRDPSKTSPRKPRPSSVATSMPSFVRVETDSPKSRSKSTERGPRDRSKGRVSIKTDDDKSDGKDRKAATLPRPYDRKKIEERRQEVKKKTEERKEREKEKERMTKSEIQQDSKEKEKPPPRMSRSFVERMSAPKHPSAENKKEPVRESTPVKVTRRSGPIEAPVSAKQLLIRKRPTKYTAKTPVKDKPPKAPKESPIKSALKSAAKEDSSDTKSDSSKSVSPAPSGTPPARGTPTIQVEEAGEVPVTVEGEEPAVKSESPEPEERREPVVRITEPDISRSPPRTKPEAKQPTPEPKQSTPEPKAAPKADKPKTDKEREMEEYKAKLAEKRRLAREKAEREAEIERLKQEELQRQEEERQRLEEERQRREEEEALRLAAEARQIEEERLQKAIEAEEKRKREEAERQEQDRIAKEEAEKKAKEEAEKREKEMQERARREEEERIERKKRLEMIMKRVKTDSPSSTPEKTRTDSPTRVVTSSSSRTSLVSSEDETDKEEKTDSLKPESDDTPKFKSPLLQKLTEGKGQDGDSGTPKFKSPLLQSIMGKTKMGARLSGTRLDEMDKSTESLTKSSEELSEKEKKQDMEKEKDIIDSGISNGLTASVKCESTEKLIEDDHLALRIDVDSHDMGSNKTVIEVKDKEDSVELDNDEENVENNVSDSETTDTKTDSQTMMDPNVDSALSLSFNGIGSSSHNGDLHIEQKTPIDPKDLVDSSISVRTVDSLESPQTGNGSFGVSITESQTVPISDSTQFEEIIDLTGVPSKPIKFGEGFVNHSEDLLNLNNGDGVDNGHLSEDGDVNSHQVGIPIVAFEENATRRQDVTDLLS
ncbi:zinc finger CCCH domain-containing protein 13-like isoform X5 [Ruditapes philippinarum]|uniref:zinc finger CCCH domain-containing protein 13-like isoform X5 n=1 Tax=Ruditapes philippinarum TaxID=129788 RepID=UPI00295AD620|nr:zinc finger CCCH domain-containing protein 13-like isoform X5 [Ruditapes philippinarum]